MKYKVLDATKFCFILPTLSNTTIILNSLNAKDVIKIN